MILGLVQLDTGGFSMNEKSCVGGAGVKNDTILILF